MADHSVVDIRDSSMSCGVMELSRIDDDTDRVLYALGSRLYHPSRGNPCAMFVFSDIAPPLGEHTSSTRLVAAIMDRALGRQGSSPRVENPRTGNAICLYWWVVDHENFKVWYATMRKAKFGKVGS